MLELDGIVASRHSKEDFGACFDLDQGAERSGDPMKLSPCDISFQKPSVRPYLGGFRRCPGDRKPGVGTRLLPSGGIVKGWTPPAPGI